MIKPNIIAELESAEIEYIKKGNRIFAKSWLSGHEDKNPSVLIDVDKNTWYDFSTGKFGDSIDILAFRKGINREQLVHKPVQLPSEILINEDAKNFYRTALEKSKFGENKIKYLEKRGATKEIREILEIGSTYNEKVLEECLFEFAEKENKYSKFDVRTSPLFSLKTVGNKTYCNEMFRDRIMLPIKNEYNQTVGFTARAFNEKESIKYLNTAETEVFKKKEFLFNINNALASIKKLKKVFIVEGPFDVVAYMNAGITNVVSTLTCNISEKQLIRLLSLGGKDLQFIVAFDSDKAGMNGIKNCMELFKQFSIWNYKIIRYNFKDAGEYIEKNKLNELKSLLENPRSISSYLGSCYNTAQSLSRKSSLINTFISLIYTFPEFVANELINEFADITSQPVDFIFNLLMERKKSKTILSFILYHLKIDKSNYEMFELLVSEKLLTKQEKEVIANVTKYNLKDYENNYKLSNLIIQFVRQRAKELLDKPF